MKLRFQALATAFVVAQLGACGMQTPPADEYPRMVDFATRYAAAWTSHSASSVAAFYSENGSLTINGGLPAAGRAAVERAAQNFITGYPDLVVRFDRLERRGSRVLFHWTFSGTNSGPGGTGRPVRISGYEDWEIGPDGLVADSQGHYDRQDWDRQVQGAH